MFYLQQTTRDRFWYFAVANCAGGAPGGFQDVSVTAHFTNHASKWYVSAAVGAIRMLFLFFGAYFTCIRYAEFGVNQWNLNTLYLVFFILYLVLMGIWSYGLKLYWEIDGERASHPLIQLQTSVQIYTLCF